MDNKQLKKLSRRELLEILVEQSREIDRLQSQLDEANRKLANRELIIADAGNIAQASLQLNDVFAAAQRAADQYLDSIRSMHSQLKEVMQKEICKTASLETVPETEEPEEIPQLEEETEITETAQETEPVTEAEELPEETPAE